jgi:hypothetical protein
MSKDSNLPPAVLNEAILANITALHDRLGDALARASEACEAMRNGQRNRAIGTMLEFEHTLPECEALFRTALLLHQSAPREATV